MFAGTNEASRCGSPPPLRRNVVIRSARSVSEASVIDNVHEFSVRVLHDGVRVIDVDATAVRFPWTTCPLGMERLKALTGSLLSERVSRTINQSEHCTHMLDLAKLAIAHARVEVEIVYSVCIHATCQSAAGCTAQISRNGALLFTWHVVDDTIESPVLFAGHSLLGRAKWSSAIENDAPMHEAALILRRSMIIFAGRRSATTEVRTAAALRYTPSACLSFRPEHVMLAVRPAGYVDLVDLRQSQSN